MMATSCPNALLLPHVSAPPKRLSKSLGVDINGCSPTALQMLLLSAASCLLFQRSHSNRCLRAAFMSGPSVHMLTDGALQKPWAKPAGIPPGQLPQRAAASESRPASARGDAPPKRGASLTSALPALKLPTSSFRQQQEGTVVNPLALMGSSAAAQRTPTRHSLQVMNCMNPYTITLDEHV